MQYLFNKTIDAFKTLPANDPFKLKLEILGKLDSWQTLDNILDLMERLDYLNDYNYLRNWNTSDIEMFMQNELPNTFKIKGVTMIELLECENFTKFFNQFLIENCNPETLAKTQKVKKAFDELKNTFDEYQSDQIAFLWFAYLGSDFTQDSLNQILNP